MKRIQLLAFAAFLFVFTAVDAQDNGLSITGEKNWLALPVKNGAQKKNLELWVEGERKRWFDMELAEEDPDWSAYLDISDWKGQSMALRLLGAEGDARALSQVRHSDQDTNPGELYRERLRGQFHFSPKRGWLNDPKDRKSTRLNSSHVKISYAVFCLKKKTKIILR